MEHFEFFFILFILSKLPRQLRHKIVPTGLMLCHCATVGAIQRNPHHSTN